MQNTKIQSNFSKIVEQLSDTNIHPPKHRLFHSYLGQDLLNHRNLKSVFNDKQPQATSSNHTNDSRVDQHVDRCRQHTSLLRNKVDACSQQNIELMESIVRGSAVGLLECQWQFRLERWNCNLLGIDNEALDTVLLQGISIT